jgi:hypothetical protein
MKTRVLDFGGFVSMISSMRNNKATLKGESKRLYSTPTLQTFGNFATLTGNGGNTPIPDASKSTKGGA